MNVCRAQLIATGGALLALALHGCRSEVPNQDAAPEGANLMVFIGKRISVTPVSRPQPEGAFLLDNEFAAHYRVDSVLYGDWAPKEIQFAVFDHYGTPGFAAYETALLYVSRHEGNWVHQKYLFSPLYQTKSGEWAGCGDPYWDRPADEPRTVVPRPIEFISPVIIPRGELSPEEISEHFPSPAFVVFADRIECRLGNSPSELFRVAREGVLKARDVF